MELKAKKLINKTKNSDTKGTDRNDDGRSDKEDVSTNTDSLGNNVKNSVSSVGNFLKSGANAIGNTVKSGVNTLGSSVKSGANAIENSVKSGADSMSSGIKTMKENAAEKTKQAELKNLKPFFSEDYSNENFLMTNFIRIADRSKKYIESEVCQGAIGYFSDSNGFRYVNIFRDCIDNFGLTFFPDSSNEFYYIDPTDSCHYISLNEYFSYLKIERINELQVIAKKLGAKHFKVTYLENNASASDTKVDGTFSVKKIANAEGSHSLQRTMISTVEIAAEMECSGHAPQIPELRYLSNDSSINTLITLRMDKNDPITHQKLMIKLSNSSGMNQKDAAKIDYEVKCLHGHANMTNESMQEMNRYLQYEIDF